MGGRASRLSFALASVLATASASASASAQSFGEDVGRRNGVVVSTLVGDAAYPASSMPGGPVTHRRVLTAEVAAWARLLGGTARHERLVVDLAARARLLFGTTSDRDAVASPGSPVVEVRVGGVFSGVRVSGVFGAVLPLSGVLDASREDDAVNEIVGDAHAGLDRWLTRDAMLGPSLGVEVAHDGAWHLVAFGLRGAFGGRLRDFAWDGGFQAVGVLAAVLGPVVLGGRLGVVLADGVSPSVTPFVRVDLGGPLVEVALLYGGETGTSGSFRETVAVLSSMGLALP